MTTLATTDTPENDPRVEELKALRARRLALEAEAEERNAKLDDELGRERRAVSDAEALNKAIDEHGALDRVIGKVETDFGLVIVKRASATRFRKFQDDGEVKTQNIERFVRPCVVHPTLSEFDAWCEDQPFILVRCSNTIARLNGVRKEELEKK